MDDGSIGGFLFLAGIFAISIGWGLWDTFMANRKKKQLFKRRDTIFLENKLSEILEKQQKESNHVQTSRNLRAFRATALARGLELQKLKKDMTSVLEYLYEESAYKEVIAEDDTLLALANKIIVFKNG